MAVGDGCFAKKKVFVGPHEEVNLPTISACSGMSDVLFAGMKVEGSSRVKLMYDTDFPLFKTHFSSDLL